MDHVNNGSQMQAQRMLQARKRRLRLLLLFLVPALCAFLLTAHILEREGEALTRKDRVLDCQYALPEGEGGLLR